ncbi:TonB-dependent receptor plug domain-containing protein [Thermodesulfobacterium hydrogeniphilum]|uniref:TonB-dependent receptor plug domain-containing protein n=1 Tax=Thermodesulfobacterium hydrogeniphilum TaxID=161156 RepID=UPI00056F6B48|nr:TonB-dependent receptor [Thermodesulfobacterium hydrogeniphilum]
MKRKASVLTGLMILNLFINNVSAKESTKTDNKTSTEIPEVVVTASKIKEPISETTSNVIVITEKDIKKRNMQFVTDVLRTISEINLTQYGGPGKSASVFLRGGNSDQVLVMIDGVKVNDPTSGGFNFGTLSVDDIEKIEIIEGPQSTLYGSEAMAGVINIITKKGKGKPKIEASFETGSFGTYKPSLTLSGGNKVWDYRVTTFYYHTDGISAYRYDSERDGYKNAFISGKFGFRPNKNIDIELIGRYGYERNEYDFGNIPDDPDYLSKQNHYIISGNVKFTMSKYWHQKIALSKVERIERNYDPNLTSKYNKRLYIIDWQHDLYFSNFYTLVAGIEYRKEEGKNQGNYDKRIENKAFYLNNKVKLLQDSLILNAGLRYDDHQTFGSKTTYRIGFLYNFNPWDLKIKGNYGTGFRAPSLDDLFWPDTGWAKGNPNLKPEESWGWNIGIEKNFLNHRLTVSLTQFYEKYKNLIQWTEVAPWVWQPENVGCAIAQGLEVHLHFALSQNLNISTGYTYLDTKDKSNDTYLIYRPNSKLKISAEYTFKKLSFIADYIYVGTRYADKYNTQKLSGYSVVNLSSTYKMNKNLSFFVRVANLFNKHYEERRNYNTLDSSIYSGIKITF